MRPDYYETLGVARDATDAEIKAAYRKLALHCHPDRNPGDRRAEERFKETSEAYAVLSDRKRRARYDRFGAADGVGAFGGDLDAGRATEFFAAIFGDLLGLGRRHAMAGRDLRYTLELDLEEAAEGCEKTIHFERAEDCPDCRGTGADGGAAGLVRCERCGGEGSVRQRAGWLAARRECVGCGGAGEVPRVRCQACGGAGLVDREREYIVRVPPAAADGSTQRVPGEGSPGRRGGPAGDLHVITRVRPHPYFRREGDLLVCEVPLSSVEAALGAEIEVPLLRGTVRMKVPAGTQPGAMFRLRGKGLPHPGRAGRGDLHVRAQVETPGSLSEDARALLDRLGREVGDDAFPRRKVFREEVMKRTRSGGGAT